MLKVAAVAVPAVIFAALVSSLAGDEQWTGLPALTPAGDASAPPAIPAEISAANNAFAIDFYRLISAGSPHGNLFYSPTSIYTAFSVLYEGARADTAAQMERVFGFDPDAEARHNATARLMAAANHDDQYATLDLANALWIADWFMPYESYLDVARDTYLAGARVVDFTDESDSVDRINRWASDNTNGKIDEVIIPRDVHGNTSMVINNAIYFKGTWATQFPEGDTNESDFWKGESESVRADFMNVQGMFNYTRSDGVQVLKMPYKGDRLSMLAVLPDDRNGIGALEESITAGVIEEWNRSLLPAEVTVSVPKFEVRTKYELNGPLTSLGMPDAFDRYNADLSGIASLDSGNLYVDKAAQDAYVKVNEEGTEAAAVTTIIINTDSAPLPPPRFVADHPFLFIIQDDASSTILFMGRISDPTSAV